MQKIKPLEKLSDFGGILEIGAWVFGFLALICTGLKILVDTQVKNVQYNGSAIPSKVIKEDKALPNITITNIKPKGDYVAGNKINNNFSVEREFKKKDATKLLNEIKNLKADSNITGNKFQILFAQMSNGKKFATGLSKFLKSNGYEYSGGGEEGSPFDGYRLIGENNEIKIIIGSF